jgi:hypothetical protein
VKSTKSVKPTAPVKTWKTMDSKEKAVFVGKVCVMVCSGGYIFGGVLVEGMVYEQYPN